MGCEKNNQGTNHDWWFEIKVDGVSHKIGGSFNSCNPDNKNGNGSYATTGGNGYGLSWSSFPGQYVAVKLTEKSGPYYISGEPFSLTLTDGIGGPMSSYQSDVLCYIYENQYASVDELGITDYLNRNPLWGGKFFLSPTVSSSGGGGKYFPLIRTQHHTQHGRVDDNGNELECWEIGTPWAGNGNATIYVLDTIINGEYHFTRPYNIEIDFQVYW